METTIHSTTVLMVRRGSQTVMASDGQVTLENTVVKAGASKVKRAKCRGAGDRGECCGR